MTLPTFSRRGLLLSSAALGFGMAAGRAVQAKATDTRVSLVQGEIEGVAEGPVAVWKGIPYAAPPVGENRWRAPQPHKGWDGLRKADSFGPACIQKTAPGGPEHALKDKPQSEDCLTLNIWAPTGAEEGSLPVMVWLHGGSFRFGSGALDLYHGQDLAPRGVVVVTLNYRLGLFGTFSHPALRDEEPDGGGNFGLLDQIAALGWVRDNIAAFGGDPYNVTLFGESAGAVSAAYLMAAPEARGLFHRAIIESGGLSVPLHDRSEADAIGSRVAGDLGLKDAPDAAALRALPATDLRDVDYSAADVMPMLDERVIHRSLAEAFARGDAMEIPMLIGWNTAEAGFFGPRYWKGLPDQIGQDRWQQLQALCYGWGTASDAARQEQVASEWFAGSVSRQMALSHRGPVHAYRFGFVPQDQRDTTPGAIHTAEIPYVFGHVAADDAQGDAARALSQDLADRWAAFALDSSPNTGHGTDWTPLNDDGGNFLLIAKDGSAALGADPAAALDEAITRMELPPRP